MKLRVLSAAIVCGLLTSAAVCASAALPAAALASTPTYGLATVGAYGGEPSIAANSRGELYDTTPSGGTVLYKSTSHGQTWTKTTTADPSSGDDCVFTDQSNALYLCNLAGSQSTGPLQADIWKSLDDGATWVYGTNTINTGGANLCGTSCNPFGVDRPWADAWVPTGKTGTNDALVVLMYHDFFGPSRIWVNVSTNGGRTFGPPEDILSNFTSASAGEAALATADSACNTVPAGLRIEKTGPHPGRIYAAWITSDPESAGTGCNVTMVQAFHNLFVAWSDDGGKTWTPQLADDAGVGHDASTPFVAFTLDDQGNPYIAFATPAPSDNPVVCATESTAGSVQTDYTCAYHMWVVWSSNGGPTWDGGGGSDPSGGSARAAYEVDANHEPQTDVFPAIAAGDPGKVDVGYLRTNEIEPTDTLGKFDPGGCAGPVAGNPPTYPPTCRWVLMEGQSLNLTASPSTATWFRSIVTSTPVHLGDICNLGIFCVDPTSNRNLLDFISEAVDPTTGLAHIAYADDNTRNKLMVASQTGGPAIMP